ncbi:conserved protein of unknown function [Thauera humireducens]|nr:conserved protein of unknown function [Thauera humireducens]
MPGRLDFRRTAASGFAPMVRRMAAILACVPIALSAAPPALPKASDLAGDAATMRSERMPMVVLYSQAGCSYCETARSYLMPMSAPEAQGRRALFRQIDIDSDAALVDFSGTRSTHRVVARTQKARFTPTVRVFDADGRAVGDDIVGMRLEDFYGQYVENAIDEARSRMGATD